MNLDYNKCTHVQCFSSVNVDYNRCTHVQHFNSVYFSIFQLTPKAKLGAKALRYLKKGTPIDDQVIVDILIEEIRCV